MELKAKIPHAYRSVQGCSKGVRGVWGLDAVFAFESNLLNIDGFNTISERNLKRSECSQGGVGEKSAISRWLNFDVLLEYEMHVDALKYFEW